MPPQNTPPPTNNQLNPEPQDPKFISQPPDSTKKPLLPRLVKLFSWIFWVPFILLAVIVSFLVYEASHGVSGTEFAGLALAPFALAEAVIGVVYLVLLIIYVLSKYPTRRQRFYSLIAILVLLLVYGWQIFGSLQESNKINQSNKLLTDSEVISLINSCKVESVQKDGVNVNLLLTSDSYYDSKGKYLWRSTTASSKNFDNFVAEVQKVKSKCGGNVDAFDVNSGPNVRYINVQQASELLQQCKIKTFNYTSSGLAGLDTKPSSGTNTGIILQEYPTFSHLFIEQSAEAEMIPIARSVQKSCGGPQFYHDNNYEQLGSDGAWH